MKKLFALFLVVLLLIPCAAIAEEEMDFLVLLYLCGTDLETKYGAATDDLIEMLDAGLPEDLTVSVLVQTGGTLEWQNELIESSTTQRFLIADDLYIVDEDLGQLDMGSAETLADFVAYAFREFPADRYALVFWDHGAGATGGVCYDEITDNALSVGDINDALTQAGAYFEFIGFDACLMSTIEMAASLEPFANYMIASEELEPGSGWAYDEWLAALADDPSMDGEEIGRVVVDSFIESSLAIDPNDYVTLSVTDLSKIDALCDAVDALGAALNGELNDDQYAPIARARAGMRAFGDFADVSTDMVDIGAVSAAFAHIAPKPSKALNDAVTQAVVYSRSSANIQSASGLSILMPLKTKSTVEAYLPEYDELELMPEYSAFMNEYVDLLLEGGYSFDPTPIEAQQIDVSDEGTSQWFQWILQGSGQGTEEQDLSEAAEAYGGEAYTVTLSDEDLYNLSYVEASLMQDAYEEVGDEYGDEVYFDFGLMQDVYVDWDSGTVYGLFDGTWPTLEGQMVPMYDQIVTEDYIRSVIPATVNGTDQYLLVVFNDENPNGLVVGYSEGYDDNGNPARGYEKLQPGDTYSPLYDLIFWDEDDEMQVEVYEGDEVTVGSQPPNFSYDDVESGLYSYAFCLNDVYGDYQFTDFWEIDCE